MNRNELLAKAKAQREANDWAGSAATLENWVAHQPADTAAAYYYAMALLESGKPGDAQPYFEGMIAAGKHLAEAHYMLARCHMEQGNIAQARTTFEASHALKPTALTLRSLSNIDWMRGELERFRDRLNAADGPLKVYAYGLWIESEDFEAAERAWQSLGSHLNATPEALILRAQHLRHIEDGAGSLQAARRAQSGLPHDSAVIDAVAVGCLMCGDGPGALEAIAPMRRSQPDNQHWIAHESTAFRMLGDERFDTLVDIDSHVRAFDLPAPQGFEDISSFNKALMAELDEHHLFARHPLDQSLRAGSQTAEDLLVMTGAAVRAYIDALKGPIGAYVDAIGAAPDHPLTARNTGKFRIKGCWSVRLKAGGHHVNHVHPEGWISSAYYVSVPEGSEGRAGWIKFGEPPFVTRPKMEPLHWVQPKAGMLVLFPSYLWHGTEPIGRGATRVTAPFDVVPA